MTNLIYPHHRQELKKSHIDESLIKLNHQSLKVESYGVRNEAIAVKTINVFSLKKKQEDGVETQKKDEKKMSFSYKRCPFPTTLLETSYHTARQINTNTISFWHIWLTNQQGGHLFLGNPKRKMYLHYTQEQSNPTIYNGECEIKKALFDRRLTDAIAPLTSRKQGGEV